MTDINDLWRHDGEDASVVLTGQPAHSPSDSVILRASRDRPERFAELFDAYHGEIYRYVASRLNAGHADDLAAETFLVAFRGRARFDGSGGQVRAWLYGIATNLIRRHRRDEERKYRALGRAAAPEATHVDDDQVLARVAARGVQPELAAALPDLGGFTSAQVEQLPTDAAQLRTVLANRIAAEKDGFPAGTPGSDQRMFDTLIQLLVSVPAPPKVRAAAFTVLADLPGMHTTGAVKDTEGRTGVGIESSVTTAGMQVDQQLILDPSTHQILA